MAKYKMTLFARFFIFLIIIIPVAYIIANYINGQDGIEKFLDLFRGDSKDTTELTSPPPASDSMQLSEANTTNKDLLKQKSDSLQLLKQQLEACKNQ